MSFEQQSKSDVLARLKVDLAAIDNTATKIAGTFNADMLTANSIEFGQAYNEMNLMIEAAFADTAWDDYLTMRAAEFGIIRKAATAATTILTISGTVGAPIPSGSIFATSTGLNFTITKDMTVGATGSVDVVGTCVNTGTVGNVDPETIIAIPYSIPGISAVTNQLAASGGTKEESDADLKARYFLKVRTPATSGNANEYKQWALSVPGVGQAKVHSIWNGNGTVKVLIVDANGVTATQTLLDAVTTYIESVRPIGATVTVASPAAYALDVYADIKGTADIATVTAAINTYLKSNGFTSTYVSVAQIGKVMLDTGIITDYQNLIVGGSNNSVTLTEDQIPVCGKVTLNVIS